MHTENSYQFPTQAKASGECQVEGIFEHFRIRPFQIQVALMMVVFHHGMVKQSSCQQESYLLYPLVSRGRFDRQGLDEFLAENNDMHNKSYYFFIFYFYYINSFYVNVCT